MDWLPDEITSEIFSRLPVKSLLRARSLCKGVRDFTHNPDFVDKHLKFSSQRTPNLILQCYEFSRCTEGKNLYKRIYSLYFVQTEETPNDYSCNKVRLEIPDFKEFRVMGSCNGLICLVHPMKRYEIYVCNPCTGKYIQIPPPVSREDGPLDIVVGFGVIPETNKYKVVAVVDSLEHGDFNRLLQMIYIFTLGGTTWKRLKDNSPVLRLGQSACKAFVNGALHWVSDAKLIVSFNMDTEEFVVIPRPELELGRGSFNLRVFEGKLMLLNTSFGDRIEIWVMKDYGVEESWTRTFTVYERHIGRNIQKVRIECFLENGDVLMVYDCRALLRYNLQSASVSELIIDGLPERLYAFAHVGTLVSPLLRIDEQIELDEMDLDESNTNATSINWKLANARRLRQLRSGFPTPDEQNLSAPDPRSRGEENSEHLQVQVHQYSDATIGISEYGSTSDTAPERGVLSMEELIRLNEMGEVVTQGQKLSPEDKESLTRETDEVSHSSEELLEEIRLEELEETPSDPRELEKLNCDPMEVPPTISQHFSILRVLDLSYTEINSLPQCISILVPLQKLFLRSCELLMELPPEIGELTNLEVLDLEGTEIMCLPKEIAKLVNLTCLKVSFYGYANQTVIPRKVLPNLSRLKELIIDVTPYGEWWDVEVEAIIADLRNLKELRTLKLYLPTAKILEDLLSIFPSLANFRFTVGRHEEHFISRLPQDVEKEFNNQEKLEKGLKYINGSHIPNEITKVFKHANAFFLQCHWTAKSLSEFGHENMDEVKFCLVMECNEFRTIIDSKQYYQGKDGRSESEDFMDIDETIVLGSLKKMIIRYMKNMASIWKGPVGKGSLSYLKYLALHTCPNLTTLFTIDMLSNLINLEELIVEDCPKIDSLVSLKSSNSKSGLFLPNLKKISLLELPELVSISSGLRIAPKLERMVTFYCPKLEKLSSMDVSSTNLKVIKGEKEWWDALKWYESDLSTKHEDYLTRLFIPLRRDGDLMAQLTKD